MSWCNALLLLLLVCTECARCFECSCNNPDPESVQMCQTLLLTIEDALTSNKANLFTLRRMFFPAGAEPPELLNVTYITCTSPTASPQACRTVHVLEPTLVLSKYLLTPSEISLCAMDGPSLVCTPSSIPPCSINCSFRCLSQS